MPAILEKQTDRALSPAQGTPGKKLPWVRVAIIATVLFAAINLVLWLRMGEERTSRDMWGGTGSIDLTVKDYAALPSTPRVVLLGSSLIMYPFWAMDRQNHAEIGDIFHHHQSMALSEALAEAGVKDAPVYSFAIFGQMVSDAYIYVNEYLRGAKAPEYLVFGIAPRDFHDFDLPAPMATLTFKRLVSLSNFGSYALLYLPGFQEKADFVMGKTCFFYGRRWKLQHEVNKAVDKTYAFLGLNKQTEKAGSAQDTAGFMLAGREDVRWDNSLNEYRRRYRNIGEKDLNVQMGFLESLLSVCHERKIKVILVNMPLTGINRELFPPGFYDRFCSQIAGIAAKPGVSLIDLGKSGEFTREDFWDTTHLNHFGGHKLLKHIVENIAATTSGASRHQVSNRTGVQWHYRDGRFVARQSIK